MQIFENEIENREISGIKLPKVLKRKCIICEGVKTPSLIKVSMPSNILCLYKNNKIIKIWYI